jgi:chaperonin GroEL
MIAQNAGAEGLIVLAKVRELKDKNFGYNAQTDVYENLVTSGVIDPTKVTRTALQNAASIAGLFAHYRVRGGGAEGRQAGAGAGGPPGGGMGGMY